MRRKIRVQCVQAQHPVASEENIIEARHTGRREWNAVRRSAENFRTPYIRHRNVQHVNAASSTRPTRLPILSQTQLDEIDSPPTSDATRLDVNMADRKLLNDKFAAPGTTLPEDVVTEMQHIMRLLSLTPQELFYKWESYVIKMGTETTKLDFKTARDFKKDLQDALERESRAKSHAPQTTSKRSGATPRAHAAGGDVFGMIDGMTSATPSAKVKRMVNDFTTPRSKSARSGMLSSPAESKTPALGASVFFQDRANAGQIIESLNPHLSAASSVDQASPANRVDLKTGTDVKKFAYKSMAMKLSEASEILDDRIDAFTELVQAHHRLPDSAFGNPAGQSTAEIVAVGRIACDSTNGRLNAASIVLETSRKMGAGMRVPLKLEGLGYDLFPGKIVALRGTNVSGEYFSATEMLSMPLLPMPFSRPQDLTEHNDRLTGPDGDQRPLSMLIASGPYTTDTDLSFAPLQTLLHKAEDEKTDVVILTGPFLDLEHPLVASGDFEDHLPAGPDRVNLTDVFRDLVAAPLKALAKAVPHVAIVLVPSVRDAISKHPCWPQDAFSRPGLGLPRQARTVTNPTTLTINEVVVGISTQDVLSELRRETVHQSGNGSAKPSDDLLARLSQAVIEQRHFFPLFPPRARESASGAAGEGFNTMAGQTQPVGASLDIGYCALGDWLTARPDILVLPSVLSPFTKVSPPVLEDLRDRQAAETC